MAQNHIEDQAELYLRQHRIQELFEDLCTSICFTRPLDLKQFLILQLQEKQKYGFKTGLYSPDEINNIFTLFDLKKDSHISRTQAKEALKTMAASQFQFNEVDEALITENVSREDFLKLVEKLLGLKTKK